MKRLTTDERDIYAELSRDFPMCLACGIPWRVAKQEPGYPRWDERHHIIKPGRVTVRENLIMLCKRDHDLVEGASIRVDGKLLTRLRLSHILYLKFHLDELDRKTLCKIAGRTVLPDIALPPAWIRHEFYRWQGCEYNRWRLG